MPWRRLRHALSRPLSCGRRRTRSTPTDPLTTREALLERICRSRAAVPAGDAPRLHAVCGILSAEDAVDLDAEHWDVPTEAGERCSVLFVRQQSAASAPLRPIFVLHGSNSSSAALLEAGHLQRYARMGLLAVGVDARHHGERRQKSEYVQALIAAWKGAASDSALETPAAPRSQLSHTTHVSQYISHPDSFAHMSQRVRFPHTHTTGFASSTRFSNRLVGFLLHRFPCLD